jgi:hypothetical protein
MTQLPVQHGVDDVATPLPSVRVLNTPELFELILLSLAPRTLLTACVRVSRHWRDVIEDSSPLQQHLFFRPRWSRGGGRAGGGWDALDENPLLCDIFPLRLQQTEAGRVRRTTSVRHCGLRDYLRMVSGAQPVWGSSDRFARPEASWRRVSKPAVASGHLFWVLLPPV